MQLFFFLFLFPSLCCCLVCFFVVSAVTGRCNLAFVALLMLSSCSYIDVSTLSSMRANPFLPSFLDTYCLSISFLWCTALCIVINFLVLWSIFLSSSPVHLKNSPEYLTRRIAQVFILLIRIQPPSFISKSFLVSLRYSYLIFSFVSFSGLLVVWIQSFPSSRLIDMTVLRTQSAPPFTHSWRENICMQTFPKGISAKRNANNFPRDLKSNKRVNFQRR